MSAILLVGAHPSVVLLTVGRDVSCADINGHTRTHTLCLPYINGHERIDSISVLFHLLCVHVCADVSGSGPRQEYMTPPTAAGPHIRGHPLGDMGYGMYYRLYGIWCVLCIACVCMFACVIKRNKCIFQAVHQGPCF